MKSAIKQTFVLSLIFSLALVLTENIFYGQNPAGHSLTYETGCLDNQSFQDDGPTTVVAIDLMTSEAESVLPGFAKALELVPASSRAIPSNFVLFIWQPPKIG